MKTLMHPMLEHSYIREERIRRRRELVIKLVLAVLSFVTGLAIGAMLATIK